MTLADELGYMADEAYLYEEAETTEAGLVKPAEEQ